MPYLPSSYSPGIVAVSLLIACFASYVALDLAKRVRTSDRRVALVWWLGGSVTMGTGIWCMHFIGMVAFSLPIPLGYSIGATVVSWAAAVLTSAIGLHIASKGALTRARLAVGALTMGLGICAMHYIGMFALDMVPGIVWDMRLVLASVVIAVAASAASLWIFFWLRGVSEKQSRRYQPLAAVVMGFAICGMHYTGMAAANFPVGALCLSADGLADPQLGILIPISSAALLIMTLLTAVLDDRMRRSLKLANSRLQSANQALQKQAFQDSLTGLPNRLLFEDRLAHAVQRLAGAPELYASTRTPAKIAVLFIDLDGFKLVNDSLGHAAGDQVLKQIAQRLRLVVRESDTLARIGGDEFILLMEDIASLADAADLAQRLIEALSAPLQIHARQVSLSASVGLTLYPDHGDASRLVTNADAAMYAAKRIGGGTYAVFQAHMNEGALEQLNLHNELRHAIEHDPRQLQLYYQPKIDSLGGHVEGVEALLRWNHPERGLLVPVLFIPLAERFGLINALGSWVIDEACRQMRAWLDQGLTIHVAINLSVHQLRTDQLADRIARALSRHRLDPSHLLCEITESIAMEDIASTQRTFQALSHIGVFLSIDDFGTGYSSLSYLRRLPARQLKIDRSFIADIDTNPDARAIVSAVIRLSHELGLRVVAEGVETIAQRDSLLALRCDELQGFLLAHPMSAQQLQDWMSAHTPVGASPSGPAPEPPPFPA